MSTPLGFELPPGTTKISAFPEILRRFATTMDRILTEKIPMQGSTGWRDITTLLKIPRSSGSAGLFRAAQFVTVNITDLIPTANGAGTVMTLPAGFRPMKNVFTAAQGASLRVDIATDGQVRIYDWTAGKHVYATLTYPTADPWPSTLPGTAPAAT